MFMDQSEFQPQAATSSKCLFGHDDSIVLGNYSAQFHQYGLDQTDISRHVCPVCSKTFRASSLLDIHMRVHVGAKPFVCPVCNHRATQKGNLKLHMKKHHGRDLPSHIDLVPDSGIWGNFPATDISESGTASDLNCHLSSKKKAALAHSSLLNDEVVELIKKCQNNIGQSTMGRITESLKDFLEMAQQKTKNNSPVEKQAKQLENLNSNNNGMKLVVLEHATANNQSPITERNYSENGFQRTPQNVEEQNNKFTTTAQKQFCYCKVCGWKTTSSGYLNVHMRKHKAESHVCTICGRAFKETWYLKNHMRSHINDLACGHQPFLAERGKRSSLEVPEASSEPIAPLQEINENEIHEMYNNKALSSMCAQCGFIFENRFIQKHARSCGKGKASSERCKLCRDGDDKKKFVQALGLIPEVNPVRKSSHTAAFNPMISNSVVEEQQGTNTFLDETFLSLKREIQESIKLNGKEMTEENLKKLMKNPDFQSLFEQFPPESLKCIFNGNGSADDKITSRNGTKPRSLSSGSTQLAPYRNPAMQSLAKIGKSLAAQNSMLQNSHSGVNRTNEKEQHLHGFQCQYCPKWFKYRSVLGIHMRSHTGERPYKCTFCGYAGTQHNCLKLHIQRHHPKEYQASQNSSSAKIQLSETRSDIDQEHMLLGQAAKFSPARCPICGRVSPSPGYLKIHMRSHKKTLDHVCHICGRGFKEYWYLSTHLRTHDQEINAPQIKDEPGLSELSDCSQSMQSTLRNTLLSKQQSLPITKQDVSHMGHSYLTGSSSWSPLNMHEDAQGTNKMPPLLKVAGQPYVSKRKAFQPARHRVEPYMPNEAIRSRKSKPRKLSQGSYLTPAFQQLRPGCETEDSAEVCEAEDMRINKSPSDDDQPLDLSIPTAAVLPRPSEWEEAIYDEPLNLAIK